MPLPETERVDSHETRANHVRLMRKRSEDAEDDAVSEGSLGS